MIPKESCYHTVSASGRLHQYRLSICFILSYNVTDVVGTLTLDVETARDILSASDSGEGLWSGHSGFTRFLFLQSQPSLRFPVDA